MESSKNLNKEENNSIDSDNKKIEITEIDDNKIDINEKNKVMEKTNNKEEYLLLVDTKRQILILINYNKFHINLVEKYKKSKTNIQEEIIYLVNGKWMKEFKNFYFYKDIIEKINREFI